MALNIRNDDPVEESIFARETIYPMLPEPKREFTPLDTGNRAPNLSVECPEIMTSIHHVPDYIRLAGYSWRLRGKKLLIPVASSSIIEVSDMSDDDWLDLIFRLEEASQRGHIAVIDLNQYRDILPDAESIADAKLLQWRQLFPHRLCFENRNTAVVKEPNSTLIHRGRTIIYASLHGKPLTPVQLAELMESYNDVTSFDQRKENRVCFPQWGYRSGPILNMSKEQRADSWIREEQIHNHVGQMTPECLEQLTSLLAELAVAEGFARWTIDNDLAYDTSPVNINGVSGSLCYRQTTRRFEIVRPRVVSSNSQGYSLF